MFGDYVLWDARSFVDQVRAMVQEVLEGYVGFVLETLININKKCYIKSNHISDI